VKVLLTSKKNKQGTTTETVTPAAPVPPSPAYASPYESSSPNRTCTIEEFMAANAPAPKDANLFSMASNSSRASAPQPVAVGARSSRDTVELNERYQHYGLQRPKFHFSGSGEDGWSVTTTFLGKEFEERRLFNSKHEAKEAVSGKCLKMIKIMEEKGKLQKPQKGKKKVGMDQFADDQRDKNETVNYIGLLLGLSPRLAA
jgi:hypothetical protein